MEDAAGKSPYKSKEDVKVHGSVRFKKDQRVRGNIYSTRQNLVEFDGNKLHFTKRFTGERYAIVFFAKGVKCLELFFSP